MRSLYLHFNGMCWPLPGDTLERLEDKLRYWEDGADFPPEDRFLIASVLVAYRELLWSTNNRRNAIARELRDAESKVKQ
jgi:hypothetical protein